MVYLFTFIVIIIITIVIIVSIIYIITIINTTTIIIIIFIIILSSLSFRGNHIKILQHWADISLFIIRIWLLHIMCHSIVFSIRF